MRRLLILLILFISTSGFSQHEKESSKIFIEINVARYSEIPGLFKNHNYENKLDLLNGFKFGFKKDEKTETYVSLMKYTSSFDKQYGYTGEIYSSTGYQIGIGLSKMLFLRNRLSGQIGGEILFQYGKFVGDYLTDYSPFTFSVDGIKMFGPGIASLLQLNYKVSDIFSISANTRFGLYYRFKTSNADFKSDSYFNFLYEPINSLSLRVNIK